MIFRDIERTCSCGTGAPRTYEKHRCHVIAWTDCHEYQNLEPICDCCIECEYRCYEAAMANCSVLTFDEFKSRFEGIL